MTNKKDTNKEEKLDLTNLITLDESRVKEIFDHDYQNKFIKVLLNDNDFFSSISDIIVPQYFDDYQRLLIDKIIKYFNKNSNTPDYEDLKRQVRVEEKNEIKKDHLIGLVDKIKNDTVIKADKSIKDTAYTFFKKRAVADALYKMASMWGKDDFESMAQPLVEALRAGEKKNNGIDYQKDIEKTLGDDARNPVKIMEGIDEEIDGGLAGGELAVVLAPTGGGKSMVLVAMAAYAVMTGTNVLYISLELSEKYISKRFHSTFTGIPLKELKYFPDAIKEKIEELFNNTTGKLKIKSFPTRRATVPTLKNYIESLQRNENFKTGLLVLDYATILNSSEYDKDLRLAQQILYQELRGMGGELDIPVLSADQTNRASSKLEYLTTDNVAESYAKLGEVDLVLGVGRGETGEKGDDGKPITLKQLNKATLGFLKNRMGADGFYKHLHFDTSRVDIKVLKNEEIRQFEKSIENPVEKNLNNFSTKITEKNAKESINSILERENNLSQ